MQVVPLAPVLLITPMLLRRCAPAECSHPNLVEFIQKHAVGVAEDAHPMVVLRVLPVRQVGQTQDLLVQLHWYVLHLAALCVSTFPTLTVTLCY